MLFVNVPIGLLIALATPRWIRESERHPGNFDITGALTATAGMVLLVYGFIRAAQEGWRDPFTLASFAAAVVLLVLFVLIEKRSRQPITPLHMFADRNRAGTYGIMLCLAAAIFGMFFFLTLFTQNVLGFSPWRPGSRSCRSARSSPSAPVSPRGSCRSTGPSPSWWAERSWRRRGWPG